MKKKKKYEAIDPHWKANTESLYVAFHNHLVSYKNIDRIHINACHLNDWYFGHNESMHPWSQLGMFIRACITAGYVKAKEEMKNV